LINNTLGRWKTGNAQINKSSFQKYRFGFRRFIISFNYSMCMVRHTTRRSRLWVFTLSYTLRSNANGVFSIYLALQPHTVRSVGILYKLRPRRNSNVPIFVVRSSPQSFYGSAFNLHDRHWSCTIRTTTTIYKSTEKRDRKKKNVVLTVGGGDGLAISRTRHTRIHYARARPYAYRS